MYFFLLFLFFLWLFMMKVMAIITFCFSWLFIFFFNQEKWSSKENNVLIFFFPSWKYNILAFRNNEISSKTYFLNRNRKYLVLKHFVVYLKGVKSTLLYVKPCFITFLIVLKSSVSSSKFIRFYFSTMLSQCLWIKIYYAHSDPASFPVLFSCLLLVSNKKKTQINIAHLEAGSEI